MKLNLLSIFLLLSTIVSIPSQAQTVTSAANLKQLEQKLILSKIDTNRIRIQLQIGGIYLRNVSESNKNTDSLFHYIESATTLANKLNVSSLKYEAMMLKVNYLVRTNDTDGAHKVLIQMITDCKRLGQKRAEADAWDMMAKTTARKTMAGIEESIGYTLNAKSLFKDLHDRLGEANMLVDLGFNHRLQNKFDLAEKELLEAIGIYKSFSSQNQFFAYWMLANMKNDTGQFKQEITYLLEAEKFLGSMRDDWKELFCMMIIKAYDSLGMDNQVLSWSKKTIEICKAVGIYKNFYFYVDRSVAVLLIQKKNLEALNFVQKSIKEYPPKNQAQEKSVLKSLAKCYMALKQYSKAERSYAKLDSIFKTEIRNPEVSKIQINTIEADHNYDMANYFYAVKNFEKADQYLKNIDAKLADKKSLPPSTVIAVSLLKFRVDSAMGRYMSAVKNFMRFKVVNDSIFTATKSKQIEELQIKYETEKHQKEIQSLQFETEKRSRNIRLLENQRKIQHSELQKLNFERKISIAGVLVLLAFSGIIYYVYRNKKLSHIALEEKQKKINEQYEILQLLLTDKDRLLSEKDWLLKEVHHRVKNNLQIIMSLLNSQSAHLQNTDAILAIQETRNRVQAISLLHQKLYSSKSLATINMPLYISELITYFNDGYDTSKSNIFFDKRIDNVELDLTQAVPLGLILNEALTNAVKYAFDRSGGQITIQLKSLKDIITLTIKDNGKGMPQDFDFCKVQSLGMIMMKGLSDQLNGSFELQQIGGVQITITFVIATSLKLI